MKVPSPANFARVRLLSAALLLLAATALPARAWYLEGSAWPRGSAQSPTSLKMLLTLQQGGPADKTLADGSTSWNQVAAAALNEWNQYLATVRFNPVSGSTVIPAGDGKGGDTGDSQNSVIWSSGPFGEPWGNTGTIGLTYRFYYETGGPYLQLKELDPTIEADVLFNSTVTWDSYRGPLRANATDFRRVALHEFGHVLGLDHPNLNGQNVSSDMNSQVSNLDDLTADDIGGVQNLYDSSPLAIVTQPASAGVTTGSTATLTVVTSHDHEAAFQWFKNGVPYGAINTTGTGGTLSIPNAQPGDSGSYIVTITDRAGTISSNPAVISIGSGPQVTATPQSQTGAAGSTINLSVAASGGSGLTYQWYLNGAAIAGANGSVLALTNLGALDAGQYSVAVSNGGITTTTPSATITVTTDARLMNLSTSALAGTGAHALSAGFTVQGVGRKNILIRGIGPTLGTFGQTGVLAQPQLTLFQGSAILKQDLNGWGGTAALQQDFANVYAFPLPTTSLDAAISGAVTVTSGSALLLSAQVASLDDASQGLALVEVYDEDSTSAATRLSNLSVLSQSLTATAPLRAGFVISGTTSETVLVRASGPALAAFGYSTGIANPVLSLVRQSDGAVLATNAGWNNDSRLSAAFSATFAFPFAADSSDSAVVATLPPGGYSASVSDAHGASGASLIEVYEVR